MCFSENILYLVLELINFAFTSALLEEHDKVLSEKCKCSYHILFVVFGITPPRELYRVWVLHLSLIADFIQMILNNFSHLLTEIVNKRTYCECRKVFDIFVSDILQLRVIYPLLFEQFKITIKNEHYFCLRSDMCLWQHWAKY